MKKNLLIVLLALALLLSACGVDTSQPWKDDTGHWHNIISTTYIQVPAGEDRHGNTRYINVPHQSISTQCVYE